MSNLDLIQQAIGVTEGVVVDDEISSKGVPVPTSAAAFTPTPGTGTGSRKPALVKSNSKDRAAALPSLRRRRQLPILRTSMAETATEAATATTAATASAASGKGDPPPTPSSHESSHLKKRELREHDVVCEKGRGDHERWKGNKLYRDLVRKNKDEYNDLPPIHRSRIICKLVEVIIAKDGWFVQFEEATRLWCELHEDKVRKKISDDLRREIRRKREKRASTTVFHAKLKAIKEQAEDRDAAPTGINPVSDPSKHDVLFGAGARRHPGNKLYWSLMQTNLDRYIISPYGARSMISRSIVDGIKEKGGRFLEQDSKSGSWYEINEKRAVEKTSHALSNKKYKSRKKVPESPCQRRLLGKSLPASTPTAETSSVAMDCDTDNNAINDGGVSSVSTSTSSSLSTLPPASPQRERLSSDESAETAASLSARKTSKKFRLLQRVATEMRDEMERKEDVVESRDEMTMDRAEETLSPSTTTGSLTSASTSISSSSMSNEDPNVIAATRDASVHTGQHTEKADVVDGCCDSSPINSQVGDQQRQQSESLTTNGNLSTVHDSPQLPPRLITETIRTQNHAPTTVTDDMGTGTNSRCVSSNNNNNNGSGNSKTIVSPEQDKSKQSKLNEIPGMDHRMPQDSMQDASSLPSYVEYTSKGDVASKTSVSTAPATPPVDGNQDKSNDALHSGHLSAKDHAALASINENNPPNNQHTGLGHRLERPSPGTASAFVSVTSPYRPRVNTMHDIPPNVWMPVNQAVAQGQGQGHARAGGIHAHLSPYGVPTGVRESEEASKIVSAMLASAISAETHHRRYQQHNQHHILQHRQHELQHREHGGTRRPSFPPTHTLATFRDHGHVNGYIHPSLENARAMHQMQQQQQQQHHRSHHAHHHHYGASPPSSGNPGHHQHSRLAMHPSHVRAAAYAHGHKHAHAAHPQPHHQHQRHHHRHPYYLPNAPNPHAGQDHLDRSIPSSPPTAGASVVATPALAPTSAYEGNATASSGSTKKKETTTATVGDVLPMMTASPMVGRRSSPNTNSPDPHQHPHSHHDHPAHRDYVAPRYSYQTY